MRSLTRTAAIAAAACLVGACVSGMGRISSYGMHLADAKVVVGSHHYSIWVHQSDATLLVQRGAGEAMAGAMEESASHRSTMDPGAYWRAAAQAVAGQAGCTVVSVDPLDFHTAWEAAYKCPAGFDLRAFAASHRAQLRAGISVPTPT